MKFCIPSVWNSAPSRELAGSLQGSGELFHCFESYTRPCSCPFQGLSFVSRTLLWWWHLRKHHLNGLRLNLFFLSKALHSKSNWYNSGERGLNYAVWNPSRLTSSCSHLLFENLKLGSHVLKAFPVTLLWKSPRSRWVLLFQCIQKGLHGQKAKLLNRDSLHLKKKKHFKSLKCLLSK